MAREVFFGRLSEKFSPFLSKYEKFCKSDPEVQKYQDSLGSRINPILDAFQNQHAGNPKITVKMLEKASTCLFETQSETRNMLLQHIRPDFRNSDAVDIVNEYFANSSATSEFCNACLRSIRTAKRNHLFIKNAINNVPPGKKLTKREMNVIATEMQNFRNADTPFTEDFISSFRAVQTQNEKLLERLKKKNAKRWRKAGRKTVWGKVLCVIFVAALAAVVVSGVIAAAILAPPVVALAGAAAPAAASIGSWLQNLWRIHEARQELVQNMEVNTFSAIEELKTIKSQVDNVANQIENMGKTMSFWFHRGDLKALQLTVDNLKETSDEFMKNLDALEQHVNEVKRSVIADTTEVLAKFKGEGKQRSRK